MALGDRAVVERLRQADHDRVVGLAERRRVADGRAHDLGSVDQALRAQEADRQLRLVTRGAHRDRHGHRILARPGRPDLEWRLADDPVVAHLERFAADRHDPPAGHVAGGRGRRSRMAA